MTLTLRHFEDGRVYNVGGNQWYAVVDNRGTEHETLFAFGKEPRTFGNVNPLPSGHEIRWRVTKLPMTEADYQLFYQLPVFTIGRSLRLQKIIGKCARLALQMQPVDFNRDFVELNQALTDLHNGLVTPLSSIGDLIPKRFRQYCDVLAERAKVNPVDFTSTFGLLVRFQERMTPEMGEVIGQNKRRGELLYKLAHGDAGLYQMYLTMSDDERTRFVKLLCDLMESDGSKR